MKREMPPFNPVLRPFLKRGRVVRNAKLLTLGQRLGAILESLKAPTEVEHVANMEHTHVCYKISNDTQFHLVLDPWGYGDHDILKGEFGEFGGILNIGGRKTIQDVPNARIKGLGTEYTEVIFGEEGRQLMIASIEEYVRRTKDREGTKGTGLA